METERKAGKLAKPPGGSKKRPQKDRVANGPDHQTLAKQGIDKHLADRARKAAAMPEGEFEAKVARAKKIAVAVTDGDRKVLQAAKAEGQEKKRRAREAKVKELGTATRAAAKALGAKVYNVIYADPPWRFKVYDVDSGSDRNANNHYPTMLTEDIAAIKVPAAEDAVLFLWATSAMLTDALLVMQAWGFTYKASCVWNKDKIGLGYWFRTKHEFLLVGVRGKIPAPSPGTQPPSIIDAPRGAHSAKPDIFHKLIVEMFPHLPRLEMFARGPAEGFDVWGNEAASSPELPADGSLPAFLDRRSAGSEVPA
jgi:N6-adenosine-specific RNA methylase IME4